MPPITSERHHWWPKSLSQFWAADDGCVTRLSPDGREVRKPPASFGITPHAHNIRLKEPWASSFELVFNSADGHFPDLIEWLAKLQTVFSPFAGSTRFLAAALPEARRAQLAECLSSLIARSPRFRNKLKLTAEYYRKRFGMEAFAADKTLVAANVHGSYETFRNLINGGGKFMVGFSDSQEFIFGDGFLSNFTSRDVPLNPVCLLPLTPSMIILFVKPGFYRTRPELATIRLSKEEVIFFNEVTQIYSKDQVFYRLDKPADSRDFAQREFLEFKYHPNSRLDSLINGLLSLGPAQV